IGCVQLVMAITLNAEVMLRKTANNIPSIDLLDEWSRTRLGCNNLGDVVLRLGSASPSEAADVISRLFDTPGSGPAGSSGPAEPGVPLSIPTAAHALSWARMQGVNGWHDREIRRVVLLPLLRARGDHRLDLLMLSHRDNDHVGGAAALLRSLPIDALSSSIEDMHPLRFAARLRQMPSSRCTAGSRWEWDGVRFEVLHPGADDYAAALRPNTMSCVLKVEGLGGSALLTGDIERDQEIRLLRELPERLRSEVLVVPHHGSKTSSTAAFIDAVAPRVAVFQAGHRNRYGHPAAEVLARYQARDINLVDSPACGAWRWYSDSGADRQSGVCHRAESRRYWHWQPEIVR
ncbi:MAG: MBL fold metallo-hydrolase, partial [Burkholderiaceae bacterium]|nr:MBL fold metallo-hydrolase [Burkholderiaceae bacterium]